MLSKIVGFLIGFIGSMLLIILVFYGSGITPSGPGWLIPMIAIGSFTARLFSTPRQVMITSMVKASKSTAGDRELASAVWWTFEGRLLIVIVTSAIWVIGAYLIQDEYERNHKVIFLPAVGIISLFLGYRILVEEKPSTR